MLAQSSFGGAVHERLLQSADSQLCATAFAWLQKVDRFAFQSE